MHGGCFVRFSVSSSSRDLSLFRFHPTTCGNVLSHRALPLTAAQIASSSRGKATRANVARTHAQPHVSVAQTLRLKSLQPRVLLPRKFAPASLRGSLGSAERGQCPL